MCKFRDPCLNRSGEIPPEAVGNSIFDSFFRFNFRPEVDTDVISGVALEHVDMDFRAKYGSSRSKGSRNIQEADFVSNERI